MKTKLKSIITRVIALALTFIAGSALADTDELGLTPKHWYKFNGNMNSSGEAAVSIDGENGGAYFAGVNDQAMKVVDSNTHPYGSGVQYGNGAWSIVTVAKAVFTGSNATIFWATGVKSDWFGLLAPNGGTSVEVAAGNDGGITDHTLSATVNDTKEYHVYAIVYDGNGNLSLYVDGELGASKTGYTPKTNGKYQWGAVQQGMPGGTARVTDTGLDDWRLYQKALTAEEVKKIASTFIGPLSGTMFKNPLAGVAVVPAGSYGDITVAAPGFCGTLYTAQSNITPTDGAFTGLFRHGTWGYIQPHTVAMWFMVDALPASGSEKDIYGFSTNGGTNNGYKLAVTGEGKLKIGKKNPNGGWNGGNYYTINHVISAGTWYYLTVSINRDTSIDGSNSPVAIRVYLNGSQVFSQDNGFSADLGGTAFSNFYIGSGISAAGLYGNSAVVSDVDRIKNWATNSGLVEVVPGIAKTVISSDTNWSSIVWDQEGGAPDATKMVELTFNGSYTLTLNAAAAGKSIKILGTDSVDQTVKITGSAANVAAFVGKVTFDRTFAGKIEYEFDATAASTTLSLTDAIRAAGDKIKFVFKGDDTNGVTLDIGSTFNDKINTHLVFDGGTHTFKVGHGANGTDFAANATVANPTVLVTNGATLNFHGHDLCGWTGAFNANGIIKVDDGATLALHSYTGSFFYRQQFYLMPGATMTSDMTDWVDLHGGYANNNIYIPDAEEGNTKNVTISGYFRVRQDNNGIGIYVGENVKLILEKLNQEGSRTIAKRGAGTLEVTGQIALDGFNVEAGTLRLVDTGSVKNVSLNAGAELDLSARTTTTTALATGNVTINAGTSIRFPEGFAQDATITLTSGTLDAPAAARGVPVYVGASDTPIENAVIKYDTENKTVAYSVTTVVDVTIEDASAVSIADIEAAVKQKEPEWTGDVKVTLDAGAALTIEKGLAFNSVQVVCDGDVTFVANCETATQDLAKFSLVGVEGLISIRFADGITVDDTIINGLKSMASAAGLRFIFTTDFVPTAAPTANLIYRWESPAALDTLPFAGTAYTGTIELACPVTYVEADHDNAMLGVAGDHNYVFDDGFVLTASRLLLGNTAGTTHRYIQNGGSITLTKEYTGTETTTDMPLLFAHWDSDNTYAFNAGTITAENGNVMFGRDGRIAMTVGGVEGKTATFKARGLFKNGREKLCSLTILTNGTVLVGAGGVNFGANKTIVLNGGTLGAYDDATIATTIATEVSADSAIEVATDKTLGFNGAFAGTCNITKTGEGTLILNNFVSDSARTFTVDAGTLIPMGDTYNNIFVANANGTVKFAVDMSESEETVVPSHPLFGASEGTLKYELTLNADQIKNKTKFTVLTLPAGMTKDDFTFCVINVDTGNEVDCVSELSGNQVLVYANVVVTTHEFTPEADGAFTWQAGEPFGEGTFKDYDNAIFKGAEYTNAVTVGGKRLEAGELKVGGVYTFTGAPVIVDRLSTLENANATFNNDLVAGEVAVTSGVVNAKSLVASDVLVSNATINAQVVGPSMKFIKLSITKASPNNRPAVGEFRLYRGNATTGYTIVDWPKGTKISDSTGLKATKDVDVYPTEIGAGQGGQGGNECQPGDLIDGYYGNVGSPKIYGTGAYNTPAYNKWWPNTQTTGPWEVTIEFPYPVAMFSGCNFCLTDVDYRSPLQWTISVSADGTDGSWIVVNDQNEDAQWSGTYAWAGGDENVPAFLNTDTTPASVAVGGDTTIVADGSWTVDLEVSGNLTLKGVPEKHLTLDGASESSFAQGAKLTFDLSAYAVTSADKQYVIAGPLEDWPALDNITVIPEGFFVLGKDEFGYYATVQNGTYWIGEKDKEGAGIWDACNTAAWGLDYGTQDPYIWLNDVDANFACSGTVTVVEGVKPTAINFVGDNAAVEFNGAVGALDNVPVNFTALNCTLTINNESAYTQGEVTETEGVNATIVKKGAGALTLAQDLEVSNFKLEGGVIDGDGTLIISGKVSGSGIIPNLWLADGATADLTALTVSNLMFNSAITLVLNDAPTAANPIKIVDGEFDEEVNYYDTIVTVKVGEATAAGDFVIAMKPDGLYVTVNDAKRWTDNAGDGDWNNANNWAGGVVPVEGDKVLFAVNGTPTLILPEEGVAALGLLRISGAGTLSLDASKFAKVGAITVVPEVTIEATSDVDVALAFTEGSGAFVKKGEGKLTIDACDFSSFDVQAGTLDFFVAEGEEKTISSVISGAGAVAKSGEGTLTLMPVNTYTGGTIVEAGTLKFGGNNGSGSKGPIGPYPAANNQNTSEWDVDVVVKNGAVLDINGQVDMTYIVELEEGAIFKNGSGDIGTGNRQTRMIKLSGNAIVDASANFGLHNGGNNQTKLELGTNTLAKAGAGAFELVATEISGTGIIDITAGKIVVNNGNVATTANDATINIGANTSLELNSNVTVKNLMGEGEVTGGSRVTVNGTLDSTVNAANVTFGDGAMIRHTDAVNNVDIKSTWTFNGKVYIDITDEVLDADAPSARQGLNPVMVSWANAGDAFDSSTIIVSKALKDKLDMRSLKLTKDDANKCFTLTRSLGFLIMLK